MTTISKVFHSDKYMVTYSVEPSHHNLRIDQFMQLFLGTLSREFIKKKVKKGEISIPGRPLPLKSSSKVRKGDHVVMVTKPVEEASEEEVWTEGPYPYPYPYPIDLTPSLIFEDEKILVISKPPFMTTHPTGRHLFHCATVYYETLLQIPLHSIHRLDRETSGILVLGKCPQIAQEIGMAFERREVQKCYFLIGRKNKSGPMAVKISFPFTARERLSLPSRPEHLMENGMKSRLYVSAYPEGSDMGRSAQTSFDLVCESEDFLLALAYPKTGRQHQIRAHASFHNFPLVGDKLYNGDPSVFIRFKDKVPTQEDFENMQIPRHALHAWAINFSYTQKEGIKNHQTFFGPLPSDLRGWIGEHFRFSSDDIDEMERMMKGKVMERFNRPII